MTSQVGLPDDVDENEEDGRNDEVVGSDRPTSTEHDDSGHRCRHDDDDVTTTTASVVPHITLKGIGRKFLLIPIYIVIFNYGLFDFCWFLWPILAMGQRL